MYYCKYFAQNFGGLLYAFTLLLLLDRVESWGFSSKRNLANLPPSWISNGCDKEVSGKLACSSKDLSNENVSTVFVTSVHSISLKAACVTHENSSITRNFTTTVVCGTATTGNTSLSLLEKSLKTDLASNTAAATKLTTTHTHTTTSSVTLSKVCASIASSHTSSTSTCGSDSTVLSTCNKKCKNSHRRKEKRIRKDNSEETSVVTSESDGEFLEHQENIHNKRRNSASATKKTQTNIGARHETNSYAHFLLPYPFMPPKDCSFSFTRLIRVNLYYYIRSSLNRNIDVDDIKVTHCCFNSENDETTVESDVEFRNTHRHLLSQLEMSLDRIEPSTKEVKISKFQACLIDQSALGDYAFHLIPMKNYELQNANLAVNVFRKFVGIILAIACGILAVFIYIQWNQLQRNTSNFYALSV